MEEQFKTAKEILDETRSISVLDVMNQFGQAPNIGAAVIENLRTEAIFIGVYISNEVRLELARLGFRYRTHIGPSGETVEIFSIV